MLVRLRPAWEDLKTYLTAKGRKRFEVYVCTMAERDYALEMWRLLDPEAHLISSKQLLDRVVCVKSGILHIIMSMNANVLLLAPILRSPLNTSSQLMHLKLQNIIIHL